MAYELRERKYIIDPQQLSFDNSDEETANDSSHSDPDYEWPPSSMNANSVQRRRPGHRPKKVVVDEQVDGQVDGQNLKWNGRRRRSSCVCKYCEDGGGELLECTHCKKKYHWKCFMERKELDLNSKDCSSFCGHVCRCMEDLNALKKLL